MALPGADGSFGLTQDQVAAQAGKNRSTVANLLRLLDLPEPILEMLRNGSLSAGHARAVLMLEDEENMVKLAQRIVEKELSVRRQSGWRLPPSRQSRRSRQTRTGSRTSWISEPYI